MDRRSARAGVVALPVAALSLLATCATTNDKIGDETHFACGANADCKELGASFSCVAGTCAAVGPRDSSVIVADAGSDGRPDASSVSTPAPKDCPPRAPGPGERCTAPVAACDKSRNLACTVLPNAPGLEECAASVGGEYGSRCCFTGGSGGCGFDYGNGCTAAPYSLPGQSASGFSTCGGATGGVERVYEALPQMGLGIAMNDSYIYVGEIRDPSRVIAISKSTCASTVVYDSQTLLDALTATEEAVYFVEKNVLYKAPNGEQPAPVPLSGLFSTPDTQLGVLGSDGQTVYLAATENSGSLPATASVVSIPCCNTPPVILGTAPAADWTRNGRLHRDGNRLFVDVLRMLLDGGPQVDLSFFDLNTQEWVGILERASHASPLGVHDGRFYLAQPGQISALDVDTCGSVVAMKDRLFDLVLGFAADDHAIYWAETYNDLTVSRIFMKVHGSNEAVRLVEPSGHVEWIGVDATHLYWLDFLVPQGPDWHSVISRIALPK